MSSFEIRKIMILDIANNVSKLNDVDFVTREVGKNTYLKFDISDDEFDINLLIDKYNVYQDDRVFSDILFAVFNGHIYHEREILEVGDKQQLANLMLTTFKPVKNFYIEKCPRSDYWHNTCNDDWLLSEIEGVKCVWAMGSPVNSMYIPSNIVSHFPNILNHLENRWKVDLLNYTLEINHFIDSPIVGELSRSIVGHNVSITKERAKKQDTNVHFFYGDRMFEIMSYEPACKQVLNYFDIKVNKISLFGISHDFIFIENISDNNIVLTNDFDRELLRKRFFEFGSKSFDINKEHKGSAMDLTNVEPLKMTIQEFPADVRISDKHFMN